MVQSRAGITSVAPGFPNAWRTEGQVRYQSRLEVPDDMLQHVPSVDLQYDGACAQAVGLDLPIVVINLPHRSDRWQTLSRRMSVSG